MKEKQPVIVSMVRYGDTLFYSVDEGDRYPFEVEGTYAWDTDLFGSIALYHHTHGGWDNWKEELSFRLYKNKADKKPLATFLAFREMQPEFSIYRTE